MWYHSKSGARISGVSRCGAIFGRRRAEDSIFHEECVGGAATGPEQDKSECRRPDTLTKRRVIT